MGPGESMSKTQEPGLNKGCSVLQAPPTSFDGEKERVSVSSRVNFSTFFTKNSHMILHISDLPGSNINAEYINNVSKRSQKIQGKNLTGH